MLTIGEFSKICMVTKKTLRHYDEIGLLKPEYTAENGYRYYKIAQLKSMLLISKLKSYGFSLPETAAVLARGDSAYLADMLEAKHEFLQAELQDRSRILDQMRVDADKLRRSIDIMEQNIVVKTVTLEPVRIYSLRKKMSLKDFDEVFTTLYATAARQKLGIAGPPITIYHDEEFDPEHSDIEVGVPVTGSGDGVRTLEGGLCCYATHIGPYDAQFSSIYAALTEWIDANGYTLNGPPYDKYVRGYSDEGLPPSEFVTEVYFPIRQK